MNIIFLIFGCMLVSTVNLAAMNDSAYEMVAGSAQSDEKVSKQQKKEARRQARALTMLTQLADCYEKAAEVAVQELKTPEVSDEFKEVDEHVEYVLESVVHEAEALTEPFNRLFLELEDQDFVAEIRQLYGLTNECFFSQSTSEPYFTLFRRYASAQAAAEAVKKLATDLRAGIEVLKKQYAC